MYTSSLLTSHKGGWAPFTQTPDYYNPNLTPQTPSSRDINRTLTPSPNP